LILGLVLLAACSAAAVAQPRNVVGLPPEAASRLPGVPHLFQVRNASAPPQIRTGETFKLGEVIVRFHLEMSDEEIEQLARFSGADQVTRTSPLGLFLVKGRPTVRATRDLMERLWNTRTTVDMTPNYLGGSFTAVFSPDDPHFDAQWHLEQPSDIDLDLPEAWAKYTQGSEDVVVAATDSGIRLGHPELAGRLFVNPGEIPDNDLDDDGNGYTDDVSGWNTIKAEPDGDVSDVELGHGTWVAGILLANADNAFQVAGVDHHAKLLPLKIGDSTSPAELELQALIAALDYLAANPDFAQVVNMSVAGYDNDLMLRDALTAAAQTHILIGGAGNTGVPKVCVGYPNGHPDVITIGATNSTDTLATFTTTGPCLDFVAPGVGIFTASFEDPTNALAFHAGDGTSFSTPMVAGIATLCKALWPAMTQADFYAALQASAVDLGAPGKDDFHGWGRPNALGTLDFCTTIFQDGFESGDTGQWN
jgi:hypothetical protein